MVRRILALIFVIAPVFIACEADDDTLPIPCVTGERRCHAGPDGVAQGVKCYLDGDVYHWNLQVTCEDNEVCEKGYCVDK